MDRRARLVLCVDAGAGATVGLLLLVLRAWVADLYGLPLALVEVVGAANLAFASGSGTLAVGAARGRAPSRAAVAALITANATWAAVCLGLVALTWPSATVFGVAHLALEGLFVGGLAALEARLVLPPRP
ncbi:MAG: hypothetical protein M9894_05560 [Planctomycetes bacterium]|nr:hypothetical protein [Planctomycetota bacterium]